MVIAFIAVLIITVATGAWIAIAGILEKYTEYWDSIGYDISKLKDTPPELWGAIGFVTPPQSVTIKRNATGEPGESTYYAQKNFNVSVSPELMQVFANSILTGAKTLAESDWKDTQIGVAKAREVKQEMLRAGLIELKNPRNRQDGFMLNDKGFAYLYQYASEWVKDQINLRVATTPDPTPLPGPDTPKIAQ